MHIFKGSFVNIIIHGFFNIFLLICISSTKSEFLGDKIGDEARSCLCLAHILSGDQVTIM